MLDLLEFAYALFSIFVNFDALLSYSMVNNILQI